MMTPIEIAAAALQADADRTLSAANQRREEMAADAVVLARKLRATLGIELHTDTALTRPVFEIGRFRFTLEKRLADIGANHDYHIVVEIEVPPEAQEQYGRYTSPAKVANLADLGKLLRFADGLR